MDPLTFVALVAACAPQVDIATAYALVAAESSFNANAIGVVAGSLQRQPRNLQEALTTAKQLRKDGWNYSVGLAQINVRNFERLGLTVQSAVDPCVNLGAMQVVLTDCYDRAMQQGMGPQRSLRRALSCYYSGNFVTGFQHGYVSRVARSVPAAAVRPPSASFQPKESP